MDKEVMEIIGIMVDELRRELAKEIATKKPNKFSLIMALGLFRLTSKGGIPSLFNDVHIFAEECMPKLKASFLATNRLQHVTTQVP